MFLGCIRRFQLRARLAPPWRRRLSPLTDPTEQDYRSGFLQRDSPRQAKNAGYARNTGSGPGVWRLGFSAASPQAGGGSPGTIRQSPLGPFGTASSSFSRAPRSALHFRDSSTCSSAKYRSVNRVRDELPISAENSVRVRPYCQFFSRASRPSNLNLFRLFSFRKQQPTLELISENPVLCPQIFAPQQEFLVDHSGDAPVKAKL